MNIADLVEDYTLPKWEEYPGIEGFKVLIRLPDIPKSFSLAIRAWHEEQKELGTTSDIPVDLSNHLVRFAVADWQGLKVAGLRLLVPDRKISGEPDQEIPFSPENLGSLLSISAPFFMWVLGRVRERQEAASQEAEEAKN